MDGFVKIYGSKLITSSLWDESPEARLVFLSLLSIADSKGYVDVPNERSLARVLNLPIGYVNRALAVLMAPDRGSRTDAHEGRRVLRDGSGWRCVNYEKYREFRSAAQEATRARVEKFRATKAVTSNACNATVSQETAEAEAEAEAERDPDAERALTPPVADPETFWHANTWFQKFGDAWAKRHGTLTYRGSGSDSRVIADLGDMLSGMPGSERLETQRRAPTMFAKYLGDTSPGRVKAAHPWKWFVEDFNALRARGRPPPDLVDDLPDLTPPGMIQPPTAKRA